MRSEIRSKSDRRPGILAPVNAMEEAEPLLEAGAHWLYGGVLPEEWSDRFPPTVLLNQRTFPGAQFKTISEIQKAVQRVRDLGGHFALTLNAPFYMDPQMPMVLDLARWAADAGVGALIVADPGLITRLKDDGNRLPLHLSTMGIASNARSVDLYAGLGVERVILPRFLNLDQISSLRSSAPAMEFEAFILVGKCPNIEGVCTFIHDSPDQRWPCEWEWKPEDESGGPLPVSLSGHFTGLHQSDRRDGCGLCALPVLKAMGVKAFKIVGRGAPLKRKLLLVGQLDRLMTEAPSRIDGSWIRHCMESYQMIFGHQCSLHICYYPEIYPAAGSAGS